MHLQDAYYRHAQRILGDGLQHSPGARAWARSVIELAPGGSLGRLALAMQAQWLDALPAVECERYGALSLRECSLGATAQGLLA